MDPEKLKQDIVFSAELGGQSLDFRSTWGLFSPRQIDEGSRLLIEHLDLEGCELALDLGCGYGAIGLSIARLVPGAAVHLVDKDFLAVEYATKNADNNALANARVYLSHGFREVSQSGFDLIVSNLPANVGKEMLSIMLHDARAHLKVGGRFYVVTIAGLRRFIKRNFEDVFGNYEKVKQGKEHTVALALRVT